MSNRIDEFADAFVGWLEEWSDKRRQAPEPEDLPQTEGEVEEECQALADVLVGNVTRTDAKALRKAGIRVGHA